MVAPLVFSQSDQHHFQQTTLNLTVEPGIYFIEYLLRPLRDQETGKDVNWDRVAELSRFGGIRIEDNLHITADGHENLTRAAFLEAEQNNNRS